MLALFRVSTFFSIVSHINTKHTHVSMDLARYMRYIDKCYMPLELPHEMNTILYKHFYRVNCLCKHRFVWQNVTTGHCPMKPKLTNQTFTRELNWNSFDSDLKSCQYLMWFSYLLLDHIQVRAEQNVYTHISHSSHLRSQNGKSGSWIA